MHIAQQNTACDIYRLNIKAKQHPYKSFIQSFYTCFCSAFSQFYSLLIHLCFLFHFVFQVICQQQSLEKFMLQTPMIGTTRHIFLRNICQGKTTFSRPLVSEHKCVIDLELVQIIFGYSFAVTVFKKITSQKQLQLTGYLLIIHKSLNII